MLRVVGVDIPESDRQAQWASAGDAYINLTTEIGVDLQRKTAAQCLEFAVIQMSAQRIFPINFTLVIECENFYAPAGNAADDFWRTKFQHLRCIRS